MKGRFVKGQSGNPTGRPKGSGDIRLLARKYGREAIETLVAIAKDEGNPAASRVSAASAILDRGYGKPHQTIEADVRGTPRDLTDAELAAIAAGSGEGDAEEAESPRVLN